MDDEEDTSVSFELILKIAFAVVVIIILLYIVNNARGSVFGGLK